MISAASFRFFCFAAAFIALQNIAPKRLRSQLVFPLANIGFLLLVMPQWRPLAVLAGFLALSYAAIIIAAKRNHLAFVFAVLTLLSYFACAKGYPLARSLPLIKDLPMTIGLSYILIRSLQVIIDIYEGTLPIPPSAWSYLNFVCAWPMLLSGPIQSYQSYSRQLEAMQEIRMTGEAVRDSCARIAWGLFSVIALADQAFVWHSIARTSATSAYANLSLREMLLPSAGSLAPGSSGAAMDWALTPQVLTQLISGTGSTPVLALTMSQLLYLVYLYFNFSGYTHIVIGVGRFAGLDIPDNFNRPWASRSFLDLWTRWHMTLANWFKTYVFNTLVRGLLRRWPAQSKAPYHAVTAFFVTFFLVGIWHGPTLPYFLCGLGLGLGASLNKLWQILFRKHLGKTTSTLINSAAPYQAVCGALALAYLSITIIPFWADLSEIVKLNLYYGLSGQTLALCAATLLLLPVSALCQFCERRANQIEAIMHSPHFVGALIILVALYTFLKPEVDVRSIYQGF